LGFPSRFANDLIALLAIPASKTPALWITSAASVKNLSAWGMGERTEVDLGQLRTVADHVMQAADTLAEMRWPTLDSDDIPGSTVGNVAAPVLVAARLTDVVANMRGWALAAHMSADAFERADRRNGERLGL
jgi:hypothetical protein